MRAPFFFSVLAVLLLFAGVTSSSDNTPRARVADPPSPSKRSATVPSKSSALKYYNPRSKPSSFVGAKVLDRLANRAAPSQVQHAPRGIPSSKSQPQNENQPARRSEQEQNVFGHDATYVPDFVSEKKYKQGCHDDACPVPLSACPVRDAHDTDAFECVDFWADLNSCGGCAAKDISYDCTAIPQARSVECAHGRCRVHSCNAGYVVTPGRDACVRVVRGAAT